MNFCAYNHMMNSPIKLKPLSVKRRPIKVEIETSRVIMRPYISGGEERIRGLLNRILALDEEEAAPLLENIILEFSDRHRSFRKILLENFRRVEYYLPEGVALTEDKRLLIGSYVSCEYSIEAAALFNPSIVPHPNQEGHKEGSLRFIMSFRATGEGHISSIEFRSGIIDEESNIYLDPISDYVETPTYQNPTFDTHLFRLKLDEINGYNDASNFMLDELGDTFTLEDLDERIHQLKEYENFEQEHPTSNRDEAIQMVLWLARSNYEMKFNEEHRISERVIFPVSENESRGIEDARFVRFVNDDGKITYYATYTAYNGFTILPQLMETEDFLTFKMITLNGKAVQNKGMALFPRKINGNYVMLSRQDGESNYMMFSENLHFWQEAKLMQNPELSWEFVQVGNCGSPIETSEGWLVLTHGVGPMRQYSISAELLDLENPIKIIKRLKEPLIVPNKEEREGYVPNVAYTCGAMVHNDVLIIPYGVADQRCGVATVSLPELLSHMQ